MSYPKNRDEWWLQVHNHWDALLNIIADQMDLNHEAFETPGNPESPMTGRKILQELIYLKEFRDSKLARYFNAAFHLASEAYAYSVPGWNQLCDLCSEEYVLHEDQIPEVPSNDDGTDDMNDFHSNESF